MRRWLGAGQGGALGGGHRRGGEALLNEALMMTAWGRLMTRARTGGIAHSKTEALIGDARLRLSLSAHFISVARASTVRYPRCGGGARDIR